MQYRLRTLLIAALKYAAKEPIFIASLAGAVVLAILWLFLGESLTNSSLMPWNE